MQRRPPPTLKNTKRRRPSNPAPGDSQVRQKKQRQPVIVHQDELPNSVTGMHHDAVRAREVAEIEQLTPNKKEETGQNGSVSDSDAEMEDMMSAEETEEMMWLMQEHFFPFVEQNHGQLPTNVPMTAQRSFQAIPQPPAAHVELLPRFPPPQ
ncbi:hypothetical protein PIB30_080391 [Stylosanthes scabra]|uniref:Uncharacterized protein n=1 Tax=Stylosanthes scabra TaxID=79078 RepID=A0ABU6SSC4_9FABA|nr:hypothetical protein [Stylosanthes scabra]